MNMIAIPKRAYEEIIKRQARTEAAVKRLTRTIEQVSQDEELRPEVLARLEQQSKLMDAGKGTKLANMKEYRAFIRSL